MFTAILVFLLVVFGAWFVFSIKIIGPSEMAVKVIFGEPKTFCDSGFCFIPFLPGCHLKRYPKKMYNFNYNAREVITEAGEEGGIKYGAQVLKVDAVAYLNFPRERELMVPVLDKTGAPVLRGGRPQKELEKTHPLIKILRSGIPVEDEKLKDWTEEAVVGALRLAFGKMTWVKAIKDMRAINEEVSKIFKDVDGALIRAGFREKGIRLVVAEIKLPKGVEEALILPEKARLKADAAQKNAEVQAIDRLETILYAIARSRGESIDVIKEQIKNNPELQREFLDYAKILHAQLEKAEKGAFFEFNAPGKSGIERSVLNALALLLRGVPGGRDVFGAGPKSSNETNSQAKKGKGKKKENDDEEEVINEDEVDEDFEEFDRMMEREAEELRKAEEDKKK